MQVLQCVEFPDLFARSSLGGEFVCSLELVRHILTPDSCTLTKHMASY